MPKWFRAWQMRRKRKQSRRGFLSRLWRRALYSFSVLTVWGMIAGTLLLAYYAHDLPDISTLGTIEKRPAITIQAEDGALLATYGDLYGEYLAYEDFPAPLLEAVLATEDRRFFDHFGVDIIGLARAMVANIKAGHIVQGGSTLTQQLAKNLFLSPERTIKRKVQEILLSLWLEEKFTKHELITIYLNRVYLGAASYGVDAAAQRYFGISARDLNLPQSAMIAGLLKAPSRYAPSSSPERAEKRAAQVLLNMVNAGYITPDVAQAAIEHPAKAVALRNKSQGSYYFTDWILDQIPDYISHLEQDITVLTTLDSRLQDFAGDALAKAIDSTGAKRNASQGAIVLMQPDGAIRAMVGGKDYRESQFNRATQARRQPGSAFKLFVYTAAMLSGYAPDVVMDDAPIRIGKWSPGNYDGRYRGPMTLRNAFAKSINTVAVKLSESIGRPFVIGIAHELGITTPLPEHPSVALGAGEVNLLELTSAYAHFANRGRRVLPYGIREIKDKAGKSMYRRIDSDAAQVLPRDVVEMMLDLLTAVIETGTGKGARLDRPAAGKTGTSQDWRDAWFVGFTADYVAGVWVGNDDASPMKRIGGGGLPASLWRQVMTTAHQGLPPRRIPVYDGFFDRLQNALPWQRQSAPAQEDPNLPWRNGNQPAEPQERKPSLWNQFLQDLGIELNKMKH